MLGTFRRSRTTAWTDSGARGHTPPDEAASLDGRSGPAGLLVTADDFGLCPEIDDAVCLLFDRGVVRRTSFIVNTSGFDRSLERIAARPGLQVGVHLNLTDGRPVSPPNEVRSLVTGTGEFVGGRHFRVLASVAAGWFALEDIRREWRAQLAKARAAGLAITHLDAHGHVHLLPRVRGVVLDLLDEFAIPFVRLVLSPDSVRHRPLGAWSAGLAAALRRRGLRSDYPRRVVGLGCQGALEAGWLLRQLRSRPDGLTELIVHPSTARNPYHRRWRYAGERELEALLAPEVAALLGGRPD
ncbi:MAG TPA: ChbG/HpnK family deacetylase [Vicinamibacteria bacterium]|nr:ChbG/HpnK family deacetylase [Vicinamibacteria bacterium]